MLEKSQEGNRAISPRELNVKNLMSKIQRIHLSILHTRLSLFFLLEINRFLRYLPRSYLERPSSIEAKFHIPRRLHHSPRSRLKIFSGAHLVISSSRARARGMTPNARSEDPLAMQSEHARWKDGAPARRARAPARTSVIPGRKN